MQLPCTRSAPRCAYTLALALALCACGESPAQMGDANLQGTVVGDPTQPASGAPGSGDPSATPTTPGASGSAGAPAAVPGATGADGNAGNDGVSADPPGSVGDDDPGGIADLDAGVGGTPETGTDSGTPDAGSDSGAPPTPTGTLLGVYCGNDPSAITQFEGWLGRPVDGLLGYTGNASWEDYDGSVGWAIGVWSALDRRVFWSVPLIANGASLEAAAAGDYDAHYLAAAQQLAQYRPQDAEVHIRTGWEFNGDWFPWSAQGKPDAFVGAFRRFVTVFRSVSDRFVFEWNVNVGDVGMNPETAYPGDDYVDIIGMDFYWNTAWDPSDPVAAWDSMRTRTWGLQWHQDFAATHGKRTSYSEWGVMSDAAGPYIERAQQWFEDHDVVFHSYWNGNFDFPGELSDGQYPSAGSAYRQAFGP